MFAKALGAGCGWGCNTGRIAPAPLTFASSKTMDGKLWCYLGEGEFTQDRLFDRAYLKPVLLAFLVAAFNQLSGINFIIYFAPRIFGLAGLDGSSALLSTAGIGLVNLAFTMLGMALIDRAGRRTLLLLGSIGYIASLAAVTWAFHTQAGGTVVVLFVFLYIAAHAVGQGAVIWVFIAEIFPNNVRTRGQSLGSGTHWVFAALITLLMPFLLGRFSADVIFGFFTVMMVSASIRKSRRN